MKHFSFVTSIRFEALKNRLIPELMQRKEKQREIRIWSAASSTGQEIYSIGITIKEHFPELEDWDVQLHATDISTSALEIARSGAYSKFEIDRGLPANILNKYFEHNGDYWHIVSDIRRMVTFKEINFNDTWPMLPPFDIVFLRNVLIYFEEETKRMILNKVKNCMSKDGYLFMGTSESAFNIDPTWKVVTLGSSTCYQYS